MPCEIVCSSPPHSSSAATNSGSSPGRSARGCANRIRCRAPHRHTSMSSALGEDMDVWRWGALHRIRFAHPLALLPGLEPLFVAAELEWGGDEQTISQGMFEPGAGYDAVV